MQFIKLFLKQAQQQILILEGAPIIRLRAHYKQGQPPSLSFDIPYQWREKFKAYLNACVVVAIEGQVFFEGILTDIGYGTMGYIQEVVFRGGTEASVTFEEVMTQSGADPLFYGVDYKNSVESVLRDTGLVPHWSMGGTWQLVSPLEGKTMVVLDKGVEAASLRVRQKKAPLRQVHTTVQVRWIQQAWGETDISAKLTRLWPEGVLTTLDPESLRKRWFTKKRVGRSGYSILATDLELIPEQTHSYQVGHKSLMAYAYKPMVTLGWYFKQKRQEVCSFTLEMPESSSELQTQLELNLGLQDISLDLQTAGWMPYQGYKGGHEVLYQGDRYRCIEAHVSGTSFWAHEMYWQKQDLLRSPLKQTAQQAYFPTERGQQSLDYALKIAESRLKESWLCQEVHFRCCFEQGRHLDDDTLVKFSDQRLPGGAILGKVVRVTHILDAEKNEYYTEVVMNCPPSGWLDVISTLEGRLSMWPEHVTTRQIHLSDPPPALIDFSADQLVHRVEQENFAPEQWAQISEKIGDLSKGQCQAILKQVPTQVKIHLADLSRPEPLVKFYDAHVVAKTP
jgi:hypothetical protein